MKAKAYVKSIKQQQEEEIKRFTGKIAVNKKTGAEYTIIEGHGDCFKGFWILIKKGKGNPTWHTARDYYIKGEEN